MTFDPQKAQHLYIEEDKKNPKHLGKEYAIFEKYDGWYGYCNLANGVIHSRANRPIPSCEGLSREIYHLCMKQGITSGTLVFEILLRSTKDFSTLNGILNRTVGDYIAPDVYARVHDWVPEGDNPKAVFSTRYEEVQFIVDMFDSPNILLAPYSIRSVDPSVWKTQAELVWSKGGEGVILKQWDAPYHLGKRNSTLMKIKEEVTLDLIVIDIIEGQGKYQGTTGAIVCKDSKGFEHTVSGMTDAQRDVWFVSPTEIVGKVVEVKAMKVLPDGQLREPRFKAIRHDKSPKDID